MNELIIDEFKKLVLQLKSSDKPTDKFKIKAFSTAISLIKSFPQKITSSEQLKDYPGFGKGILTRIDEILEKGKLAEIDNSSKSIELFKFQEEIGKKIALDLSKKNIYNLDDLKKAVDSGNVEVDHRISLILKYHFGKIKFQEKIPRKEMELFDNMINTTISNLDINLEYMICGSYRRGLNTSNDIDILIFHKHKKNILKNFINFLTEQKIIVDHLTPHINTLKSIYRGYCISLTDKNVVRRIDIRYIDYQSKYTAIMYFTGSKNFNTYVRNIAKKKGFKLNEYYLLNLETNNKIYPKSEKEVFEILDIPYKEPKDRL